MDNHIVFCKKQDRYRNLIKFKVYIVAKSFSQMPKEDFIDTFLSITKFSTLQVFLAYVAYLN